MVNARMRIPYNVTNTGRRSINISGITIRAYFSEKPEAEDK
jgi:hypothetical protein